MSSKYHDLPRGFDNYAGYADHINSNPDLNTLYSTALNQCKELGKKTELKELGNQRMGYGLILLQCNEFLPGSQLSDGVYTHQFTTLNSLKASELINGGENQRFVLRAADRDHLGEAIIEAQESHSRRGLEVKSCINGKASGFLLFNNLEEAKRSSLKRRNLNRGEDLK